MTTDTDLPDLPDAALVGAFASGERWAAEELYRRSAGQVFGLGLMLLGHSGQAGDLVRDTFLRMWRTAGSYDPARGSAGTWTLLQARGLALEAAAQVARIEGIPAGTAKSRIRSALPRLHRALAAGDEASGLEPVWDGADGNRAPEQSRRAAGP